MQNVQVKFFDLFMSYMLEVLDILHILFNQFKGFLHDMIVC